MPKQTPLYALHRAAGARMVDFGGWDMPVNYGSQIDEHHAVRTDAGMFDVSHMRVVDLEGAGARDFLRYLLANNVDRLKSPGKALYSCLLKPDGTVLDDLIVYLLADDFFRIIVNAGTADNDIAWFRERLAERSAGVKLTPRDDLAIIAVQGPHAARYLPQAMPSASVAVSSLKPFNAMLIDGPGELMIARTGYTGEDGFEVVLPVSEAPELWNRLREAGVPPCGLGARDTLRLEAGMNLYGQDMDETVTPLESGLSWTVDLSSPRDFIGKAALAGRATPYRQLVGLVLLVKAIVQCIESWVLTPKIMGHHTGLHPVAIIVAVFFWGTAFGGVLGDALLHSGSADYEIRGRHDFDIVHAVVGIEFRVGVELVAIPRALPGIAHAGLFVHANLGEPLAYQEEVVAIAGAGEDFGELRNEIYVERNGGAGHHG